MMEIIKNWQMYEYSSAESDEIRTLSHNFIAEIATENRQQRS